MKMNQFNVILILFCAFMISFLIKESHGKYISLHDEEDDDENHYTLRELDASENVEPKPHYHKSSGGLSAGAIVAIVLCSLVVLIAALLLALLCRRAATAPVVAEVIPEYSVKTPHYNIDTPGSAVVAKVV